MRACIHKDSMEVSIRTVPFASQKRMYVMNSDQTWQEIGHPAKRQLFSTRFTQTIKTTTTTTLDTCSICTEETPLVQKNDLHPCQGKMCPSCFGLCLWYGGDRCPFCRSSILTVRR